MKTIYARLTFTDEILGTASADRELHSTYIASLAPDAMSREEEIAAIGAEEVEHNAMTVFPRDEEGNPIVWDYQIKGFFKDAASMLKKVSGTHSSKIKAFKKEIDGLVFPNPRAIKIHIPEGKAMGNCQRPLRASTPMGERIALANSETCPEGSYIEIEVTVLKDDLMPAVIEWLDYGKLRGLCQWRNSGKGRFVWEQLDDLDY